MSKDEMANASDHDLLIHLVEQVKSTREDVEEIKEDVKCLVKENGEIKVSQATLKTDVDTHGKEIDKLRNTNNLWSFLNSIAIVLGTVIGIKF